MSGQDELPHRPDLPAPTPGDIFKWTRKLDRVLKGEWATRLFRSCSPWCQCDCVWAHAPDDAIADAERSAATYRKLKRDHRARYRRRQLRKMAEWTAWGGGVGVVIPESASGLRLTGSQSDIETLRQIQPRPLVLSGPDSLLAFTLEPLDGKPDALVRFVILGTSNFGE